MVIFGTFADPCSAEMEQFFAPVLRNIEKLIQKQINGVKAAGMGSVKVDSFSV